MTGVHAGTGCGSGCCSKNELTELRRTIGADFRGTAMLNPLGLPPSPFLDSRPWYNRIIEADILAGRRGVAGWDGEDHDRGLWLPGYKPPREGIVI